MTSLTKEVNNRNTASLSSSDDIASIQSRNKSGAGERNEKGVNKTAVFDRMLPVPPSSTAVRDFFNNSSNNARTGLFNRRREKRCLWDSCYLRLKKTSMKELILVSGESGTGKTSLAKTLQAPIAKKGGYFLLGKFDQNRRKEPYEPLIAAFSKFVNLVIERGQEEIRSVKLALKTKMVDLDRRLLVDTIPDLKYIVGGVKNQTSTAKLMPSEPNRNRLKIALRNFIRAVCSSEKPLVLVMDDMQWADRGTLSVLQEIIVDYRNQGFIMVAICREEDVKKGHNFSKMLCSLEDKHRFYIYNIHVTNFSEEAVNAWLSTCPLNLSVSDANLLAAFLYKHTKGNIFFMREILSFLHDQNIIFKSNTTHDGNLRYTWDESKIADTSVFSDIASLESAKLSTLPDKVKHILKIASCIGGAFEEKLLLPFYSKSEVNESLDIAEKKGLIRRISNTRRVKFSHDRIQSVTQSLISEKTKGAFHFWLGRELWHKLAEKDVDNNINLIVTQLQQAGDHIYDQIENDEMARICNQAGQKAMKSSDFIMAADYFVFGIGVLGKQGWKDSYPLCLALYNAKAEAEFCSANFASMDDAVKEILTHATNVQDKIRAYTIQLSSMGSRNRLQGAVDLGFAVLNELGEPFPSNHSNAKLTAEFWNTKRQLKSKTDGQLRRLPVMTDPQKMAAMSIMCIVVPHANWTNFEVAPLIVFRMIRLSLRYGLTSMASYAFGCFGALLCRDGPFLDVDMGFKYGQLALSILDKFEQWEWTPRVYSTVYSLINPWKVPLRKSPEPLYHAQLVGIHHGDIEFGIMCGFGSMMSGFHSGKRLDILEKESRTFHEVVLSYKQDGTLMYVLPTMQMILNLMGKSENSHILKGEVYDLELGLKETKAANQKAWAYLMGTILAYFFNEYELAFQMAKAEVTLLKSSYALYEQYFYEGLAALAAPTSKKGQKESNISKARENLKKIKVHQMDCPDNLSNKVMFLEAELAAINDCFDEAIAKFAESIEFAKKEGLIHEVALGCERAGLLCRRFGKTEEEKEFLARARAVYLGWGAHAKVSQMSKATV